jgi:peptide/nickel transport system ATP-binding protein
VSIDYGRAVVAVDRVSLSIAHGEILGLVGESGCGKTTLGKAIVGLLPLSAGTIRIVGVDVAGSDRRTQARQAQMFFQDPVASLSPRLRIETLLTEPIAIHGLDHHTLWPRVLKLLAELGLPPSILDKYPHEVSSGQARRVGIARALILDPALVVADEPTAGLDVSVQGELLNLLLRLRRERGLGILLISHNLGAVRRVADRVAIMYLGEIVETGPATAIFGAPAHPYTAALVSAQPSLDPARRQRRIVLQGEVPSPADPPRGCRFHTRCPNVAARCRVEAPHLEVRTSPERTVACHFPRARS